MTKEQMDAIIGAATARALGSLDAKMEKVAPGGFVVTPIGGAVAIRLTDGSTAFASTEIAGLRQKMRGSARDKMRSYRADERQVFGDIPELAIDGVAPTADTTDDVGAAGE